LPEVNKEESRTNTGNLDLTIDRYLNSHHIASVAVCADDQPHIARMNYVAQDYHIYIVTSAKSEKMRCLKKNPSIALTIDDNSIQRFIQYFGEARLIISDRDKKEAIKLLSKIYPYIKYWTTDPDVTFIEIVPKRIKMTTGILTKKSGGKFGDTYEMEF
jgi:nitroimidazol reductase NimA-like FMN-containing flavoprotein (pyridoxamine 5'-phosphate oxidase superfamily)